MKMTVRNLRLAWKYRRYRKLWSNRYSIGAALATGAAVGAGILLRPRRILKASEPSQ
jgi:hypothetical protein